MLLPELEESAQAKTIGKALEAKVEIVIPQSQVVTIAFEAIT